jgi:hypothetical protein
MQSILDELHAVEEEIKVNYKDHPNKELLVLRLLSCML